jgi:hypothetical protein
VGGVSFLKKPLPAVYLIAGIIPFANIDRCFYFLAKNGFKNFQKKFVETVFSLNNKYL